MDQGLRQFKRMYFFFYFTVAIFWAFIVPYLNSLKISNTQIGMIISLMIFSGVIGQFFTGYLCDVKGTIKNIFILWMILLCISVVLFFQSQNMLYMIVLISIIGFFQSSVMALSDSWVLESSAQTKSNFGAVRALGSAGWGISAVVVGKIIDQTGWHMIYILYVVFAVLLYLMVRKMQDGKQVENTSPDPVRLQDIKVLFSNKQYVQLLLIYFLLFASLQVINMFAPIIINSYGGTKFHVGLYLFVAAASEIPILFYARLLMNKFRLSHLLIFAAFALTIRMILIAYNKTIFTLILSGALQIVTFSIIVFTSKYLIDEVTPPNLKTTSQMVAMGIYSGLGGIFATILSGWLADNIGIKNMLLAQGGLCLIALLFSVIYHFIYCSKMKVRYS